MAGHLAHLLSLAFLQGRVPQSWNTSLVTPVFKKGDKNDKGNYRPISVGDCYAKLYAAVLNARVMRWLEEKQLRAPCQAGFRPGLSTEHQIFALNNFIEDCRRRKKPLFACFVDFTKAYDSVPRHLLWQVMGAIGVPAQFVRAVQSMYHDVSCMVNIGGALGPQFSSHVGVKQGCPLSPTLFGIFIDRFYFMAIHRSGGQVGMQLGSGLRVPLSFYADDGLMLSDDDAGMHSLCSTLDTFRERSGMRPNLSPGKTEMMIFSVSDAIRASLKAAHQFYISGSLVRYVQQYKYLGCQFHEKFRVQG